jgi:hypothetical protein
MKNLIIFGFVILALVCVQFAQAQTVDEVINKHIAALGGKENLNKIQNVVMEGSLNIQGNDIALTLTRVNKKLNRQDISAMGMNGFDMTTDKDGWRYMPFQGMQKPEPKTEDEVKKGQNGLDINGPFVDYAAKGNKVELQGKEDVEGAACYKEVTYYVDIASGMINRAKENRKMNGEDTEMVTDFSDYKDVEGVKMAFTITQQIGTISISSIKVNQTIPDSAFKHDM